MSEHDDLPIFRPNFGRRPGASSATRAPGFRNLVLAKLRGAMRGRDRPVGRARIAVRASTAASRVDREVTHRKRLAELEKLGLVNRAGEDRWVVQPGLVARLDEKDRSEPRYQLRLEREPLRLEEQVRHLGPVWLDRVDSESFAPYGMGAELRRAVARREEVLRGVGVDPSDPKKLARLRDLERCTLGKQVAAETGAAFVERSPAKFRGRVHIRERAECMAYAEVTDGRRFVLVPVNRELRALNGRTAVLSRDAKGRLQVRAAERDRDRGDR